MSKFARDKNGYYLFLGAATREEADRILIEMSGAEILGTKAKLERVLLQEETPRSMPTALPGEPKKSNSQETPWDNIEW